MVSTRGQRRLAGTAASPMQVLPTSRTNAAANTGSRTKALASPNGVSPTPRKTRMPKTRRIDKVKDQESPSSQREIQNNSSSATTSPYNVSSPLALPAAAEAQAAHTASPELNDENDENRNPNSIMAREIKSFGRPGLSAMGKDPRIASLENTSVVSEKERGRIEEPTTSSSRITKKFAYIHVYNEGDDGAKAAKEGLPSAAIRVPLQALENLFTSQKVEYKMLTNFIVSDAPTKRKRADDTTATDRDPKRTKNTEPAMNGQKPKKLDSVKAKPLPRSRIATTGGYDKNGKLILPGQRIEIWGSDEEESEKAAASRRKADGKAKAARVLADYRAKQAAHAAAQEPMETHLSTPTRGEEPFDGEARAVGEARTAPAASETPRRGWGLGSFVPRSVTRFVPSFPIFGHSQTEESSPEENRVPPPPPPPHTSAAAPGDPASSEATEQHEEHTTQGSDPVDPALSNNTELPDEQKAQGSDSVDPEHGNTLALTSSKTPRKRVTFKATPETDEHAITTRRIQSAKAAQEKAGGKNLGDLIKMEVDRQLRQALEQQRILAEAQTERAIKAALAADAQNPGATKTANKKRKRRISSPDEIPNPEGCSYGMDLNFFCYSSDEEDSSDDNEGSNITMLDQNSPSVRPAKRSRMSNNIETPTKQIIGNPHQATPYTGKVFADPQTNIFVEKRAGSVDTTSQDSNQSSGQFEVPYSSESDSDGQTPQQPTTNKDAVSSGSPSKQAANFVKPQNTPQSTRAQSPPPAPTPAHAALPPTLSQVDALAQARAQATRYAPKQPSGLRSASRYSTSTIASEGGDETGGNPDTSMIDGRDVDMTSSEARADEVDVRAQEIIAQAKANDEFEEPTFDPVVEQALGQLRDEDLVAIRFDDSVIPSQNLNLDPEVSAALDATWGPADDAKAVAAFEAGIAQFRSSHSAGLVA